MTPFGAMCDPFAFCRDYWWELNIILYVKKSVPKTLTNVKISWLWVYESFKLLNEKKNEDSSFKRWIRGD